MRRAPLLLSLAALGGSLVLASAAVASLGDGSGGGLGGGPGGPGGPGMGGRHFERVLAEADLAPATEAKVRAILDNARQAHQPMRQQIGTARSELHDLLGADEVDAAAVIAQADVLGNLIAQAQRMRAATLLQVRSEVTRDEWQRLRDGLDESFRGRRGGGPKGPGPRGPWAE